jgi:molybdopterin adenylyltransferase
LAGDELNRDGKGADVRVGILTISDRSARGERPDLTGPALQSFLESRGWEIVETAIVPDEMDEIQQTLVRWTDSGQMDLILTAGGTGFSPRDCTPEATLSILERLAPGLPEVMRAYSLQITPHAMLSRAVAGIRGKTLIVNLPGSPRGAKENLEVILPGLPHGIALLSEDPTADQSHVPPRPLHHI